MAADFVRRGLPITALASVLGVPRCSFYPRSKRPPAAPQGRAPGRNIGDDAIISAIAELSERDPGYASYGYRRLRGLLARDKGWTINHKRLRRILAKADFGQAGSARRDRQPRADRRTAKHAPPNQSNEVQEESMTIKTEHGDMPQKYITAKGSPDTTRERLLVVAEKLFAQKGFAGTSVREIGEALGIANASIMYHFPSKNKLYAAVLGRITDSVKAVTADLFKDAEDPSQQLMSMAERFIRWAYANTDYLQIIMRELMENPARLADARHLYLAGVLNTMRLPVEKLKGEGRLGGMDPSFFLIHLIGSVSYLTIALPTVGRILGNEDLAYLHRQCTETVFQVLDACLKAGPEQQNR